MIPKTDGDATALGQRPLSVLPVVYRIWASARMGQLEGWFQSRDPDSVLVLVVVAALLRLGTPLLWTLRRFCLVLLMSTFLLLMLSNKSFDTVDRGVLDRVLSCLGLLAWFRHAYFEHHAHVRLRVKACCWPW